MKGKRKQINGLLARVVGRESNGRRRPAARTAWFNFFFIPKPNWFGSGWLVQAHQNQKPNRTGHFSKYFNRFNRFFLLIRFFQLIVFQFFWLNRFSSFFLTPKSNTRCSSVINS